MVRSKFYEDKRQEELFGKYLDKRFYPLYKKSKVTRVYDEDKQNKGIDVIIENSDGRKVKVDEKAALHWMHREIYTFAFEITNTTSRAEGWLYNEENETEYYLLAWPHATDLSVPNEDVFCNNEIMFIRRADVKKILEERNLNRDKIMQIYREHGEEWSKEEKYWKMYLCQGIWLHLTKYLREQPLNVLISKSI